MADGQPIVDARRASKLRDALERDAGMLVPGWAGATREGDFGHALLEIAARLAEHSTSRLDRTPLRDKLAFLEALDVVTPPPRSATAPIVFTLADKRDTKVAAPARVQLTARQGKEELTFETREAIDLTPARIANLVMADPAADRIERAPRFVTRSVDMLEPPTGYVLLSAVEANARTIQLAQGIGIEPDDLLRISDGVYRVEKAKGGIVQLLDPLETPAPAGAPVEKLIALESFALRNLQDHAVYFGHKDMLKLDGTAVITLVFDPPTLPALLAGLDLEYAIWGTRDTADATPANESPGWQPLDLRGAGPEGLVLGKDWTGSIDELKLPAGKSRWVRIRLKAPIAGACGPAAGATSVRLKIRSTVPAGSGAAEGGKTIAAAFHNSQPLPTATAFFPFGPEPQRFDIFSLSAPEALSKKGATVTFTVTMVGANLQAMTMVTGAPEHVYGVSSTGRLQAVHIEGQDRIWRQLGLAPSLDAGTEAAAGTGELRFDHKVPLAALRVSRLQEIVFVRDEKNRLLLGRVDGDGTDWTLKAWKLVAPPQQKDELLAFCLLPPALDLERHSLLALYKSGLYASTIEANASLAGWRWVGTNPAKTATTLALAYADADRVVLALVDDTGRIRRGDVTDEPWLTWQDFDPMLKAEARIQPAAFLDGEGKLVVVAARKDPESQDDVLLVAQQGTREAWQSPDAAGVLGTITSIAMLPGAGLSPPLAFISGARALLTWAVTREDNPADLHAKLDPLPAGVDGESVHGLVMPRPGNQALPQLLLNAGGEQLLHGPLLPGMTEVSVELRDVVRHAPASAPGGDPTHFMLNDTRTPEPLDGKWVKVSGESLMFHSVPIGLQEDDAYFLLRTAGDFTGIGGEGTSFQLAAVDESSQEGDFLLIGGKIHEISSIAVDGSKRTAQLYPAFSGKTDYQVFRPTDSQTFKGDDRARLALLKDTAPDATALRFGTPAKSAERKIAGRALHDGTTYLALADPAPVPPAAASAVPALLIGRIGIGALSPIRLPRNADNPELSWEYHDGKGWRRLDKWNFSDGTGNLAGRGDIRFTVPSDIAPTEIAGKEDFWIRARLTGGDFGRASYVITDEPPTGNSRRTSVTIDRSQLNPPEILGIETSYVLDTAVGLDLVVADNNLAAIDQTQAALARGAVFDLFESVARHVDDADGGTRALYLGLDRRPGVQTLRLYADILDRDDERRALIAEVLVADGWQRIGIDDGTGGLVRPGMIQLHLVPQPAQLPLFGQDGWWLRLRPSQAAAAWAPVVRGLFVNAVTAEHAKSVTNELLGSSAGEPGQRYLLAQRPVLAETLELRVLESLGEEERGAIEASLGPDAIREDEERRGHWVRWNQVETFVDQDGDARVFRLDPASGEIQFGNGRCGKIPPANRDSIRAASYQWGGGSTGNVPARAIANLGTALESSQASLQRA